MGKPCLLHCKNSLLTHFANYLAPANNSNMQEVQFFAQNLPLFCLFWNAFGKASPRARAQGKYSAHLNEIQTRDSEKNCLNGFHSFAWKLLRAGCCNCIVQPGGFSKMVQFVLLYYANAAILFQKFRCIQNCGLMIGNA